MEIRFNPTGKKISKAQLDSISKKYGNRLKMSVINDKDKRVVTIDTLKVDTNQEAQVMTFSRENGKNNNQSKIKNKIYKDELGNEITDVTFKEKIKTGEYTSRYEMKSTDESGYDLTYFLVLKNEADTEMVKRKMAYISTLKGRKLPGFKLDLVEGKKVDPAAIKGKVVVLNFWFINCRPCLQEIPLLNRLTEKYKDRKDIIFLAPALDKKDKLIAFLDKTPFTYQATANAGKYADNLKIYAYPTHIILNKKGEVADIIIGGEAGIDSKLSKIIDSL